MKVLSKYFFISLAIPFLASIISCSGDSDQKEPDVLPVPTITSVDPLEGKEGTPVTITGTNFSTDRSFINVSFNGVEVEGISFSSANQISTMVPDAATTGTIIVTIGTQIGEGPVFTVKRSFTASPLVGSAGTEVTLIGEGFSSIPTENLVKFNGISAKVSLSTRTQISTVVPQGATTGPITVTVDGQNYTQKGLEFVIPAGMETPENFKIAFIGDTNIGSGADAVLNLIRNEGAQAVVHAGDLDYGDNPQSFEDNINGILGENFPYFYSAGNHDAPAWNGPDGYQAFLEARFKRLAIPWSGDLGVLSSFSYGGIFFVSTSPDELGVSPEEAGNYIRNELDADNSKWRISFWHKNQRLMQIGGKSNEAGWYVYEESRKGGAIIATGHEHSYSRTYEMSNFENQSVSATANIVNIVKDDPTTTPIDEGRSFAFVSGLGGKSIRDAESDLDSNPWWANVYHSNNGGQHGSLFGEFNYNGDASLARFYFKDIDGQVRDVFFVRSHNL
ncbi:IPT/TIG domain-containing protein [Reichenbachiella sp.]|uniref:IPT/TIG domain-containing protein n=2 Tax=Reichenbachiella sp. TaxID=2184521 RepID=UPI003298490A